MKIDLSKFLVFLLMMFAFQISFGQTKHISGTVTDENGVPLPGVNIVVKGTAQGTQTDFDGNYQMNVEEGEVLVFSFVGFKEQEETVGADSRMNVSLGQDSNALEEVIVTAFGRKITRNESTSSVSAVKAEDIEMVVHSDAREAMQGKITGLNMNTTTGTPGAEPEIRIRGINSITASNDPLYVVDGVPINAGAAQNALGSVSTLGIFSLINAADIEDMTVLKDASAVAPYGADGANGVILITTKRGRAGKTQFSLNTSVGVQNDARTRPGAIDAMDKLDALHEAVWNSYGNGELGNGTLTSKDQIDDFYDSNLGNERAYWEELGYPNYDWVRAVRNRNALVSKVNFSVSQGKENSDFYANIGYNKTESTTIGGGLQRFTGSINYGTKFGERFDFRVSANVGNIDQDVMDETHQVTVSLTNPNFAAYNIPSWLPAYNEDGSYRVDPFREFSGAMYNPLQFTHEDIKNINATRAIQNSQLSFQLTDNLSFKTVLGLDYTTTKGRQFSSPLHTGKDPNGLARRSSQTLFNYTTQNSLDYSFDVKDKHHFNVLALQEYSLVSH